MSWDDIDAKLPDEGGDPNLAGASMLHLYVWEHPDGGLSTLWAGDLVDDPKNMWFFLFGRYGSGFSPYGSLHGKRGEKYREKALLAAERARERYGAEVRLHLGEQPPGFDLEENGPRRGSAMKTRFGKTVDDPDEIDGTEGKHLDAAMDRYETFHDKAPIRVAELEHDLPKRWAPVGDALSVMYRTDKWKADGDDIDYKHLHDQSEDKPYEFRKGVRMYEPASEVNKSRVGGRRTSATPKTHALPVAEPKALTLLGYCLGIFVRRYDDGEIYETNPRGCYLFSSPSGNMLALYSPRNGFLAVMAGGKLRVLKDGIDG